VIVIEQAVNVDQTLPDSLRFRAGELIETFLQPAGGFAPHLFEDRSAATGLSKSVGLPERRFTQEQMPVRGVGLRGRASAPG
jgi:hypothetical protein